MSHAYPSWLRQARRERLVWACQLYLAAQTTLEREIALDTLRKIRKVML